MKLKTHLPFFLLSVAVACAAPIPTPISTLQARQDQDPQEPEDSPSPLPLPLPSTTDIESLIADSPLSGVYKMVKDGVKVDLPKMRYKKPPE